MPPKVPTEPPAATTRALELVSELVERTAALSARIAELEREAGTLQGRATAAEAERDATRETAADLRRRLEAAEWRWWHRFTKR